MTANWSSKGKECFGRWSNSVAEYHAVPFGAGLRKTKNIVQNGTDRWTLLKVLQSLAKEWATVQQMITVFLTRRTYTTDGYTKYQCTNFASHNIWRHFSDACDSERATASQLSSSVQLWAQKFCKGLFLCFQTKEFLHESRNFLNTPRVVPNVRLIEPLVYREHHWNWTMWKVLYRTKNLFCCSAQSVIDVDVGVCLDFKYLVPITLHTLIFIGFMRPFDVNKCA